jgi:hypothetical protein
MLWSFVLTRYLSRISQRNLLKLDRYANRFQPADAPVAGFQFKLNGF